MELMRRPNSIQSRGIQISFPKYSKDRTSIANHLLVTAALRILRCYIEFPLLREPYYTKQSWEWEKAFFKLKKYIQKVIKVSVMCVVSLWSLSCICGHYLQPNKLAFWDTNQYQYQHSGCLSLPVAELQHRRPNPLSHCGASTSSLQRDFFFFLLFPFRLSKVTRGHVRSLA